MSYSKYYPVQLVLLQGKMIESSIEENYNEVRIKETIVFANGLNNGMAIEKVKVALQVAKLR